MKDFSFCLLQLFGNEHVIKMCIKNPSIFKDLKKKKINGNCNFLS